MWLTLLLSNWKAILIGLISLGCIGLVWDVQHTSELLKKERIAHAADISTFKAVQLTADNNAKAIAAKLQQESKASADQADANYSNLLAKYQSSLVRYSTNQGNTKPANSNQLPPTQGGNGPSTGTIVPQSIMITENDADICSVNTARLVAVHDWAIGLPK